MKSLIFTTLSLFLFFVSVQGQQNNEIKNYVEVPSKYAAAFTFHQPKSPVSFQEITLLTDEKGKVPYLRYLIKNNTEKSIVSFSVEFIHKSKVNLWGKFGDGWVEKIGKKEEKIVLIPRGGIYENIKKDKIHLVEITEDVLKTLQSENTDATTKSVWIGFIKEVVFEDGSEYESEIDSTDLREFMLFGL